MSPIHPHTTSGVQVGRLYVLVGVRAGLGGWGKRLSELRSQVDVTDALHWKATVVPHHSVSGRVCGRGREVGEVARGAGGRLTYSGACAKDESTMPVKQGGAALRGAGKEKGAPSVSLERSRPDHSRLKSTCDVRKEIRRCTWGRRWDPGAARWSVHFLRH